MPTEEDDNDHAIIATTSLPATTAALPTGSPTSDAAGPTDATDVPNRPVKPKPSGSDATDAPGAQESSVAPGNSTWLPSFLPTFGVSAATQAWIYGSLVLIVLFCSGLGVYFWLARRKRLRSNPRNDYEFELLDDDDHDHDDDDDDADRGGAQAGAAEKGLAAGGRKGSKRRTRGGELYDAFAGDSDEDEDEGAGGLAPYRDQPASGSGSSGSGSPIRVSEKLPSPGTGKRDSSEETEHHVIGDSDDDSDEGEEEDGRREARPLQARR
jgi:kexin